MTPQLAETHYTSYDDHHLGYKKWLPDAEKCAAPEVVIIGVHGISGHAGDYENLANHFLEHHHHIALYAAETRGQGMDPKLAQRGDIHRADQWFRDLEIFTGLIKKLHPQAKILWFGESMGSLIITHAYQRKNHGALHQDHISPDGIVLFSPILDIQSKISPWKRRIVQTTGFLLPKLRISLETLSNGEKKPVTKQDIHEQQAALNPWYIRRYTLRLLLQLAHLADNMDGAATSIDCPLLLIHGGKDIFTDADTVDHFYKKLPETMNKTKLFYPESYHLLMYDHDKEKIFHDLSKWLTAQFSL